MFLDYKLCINKNKIVWDYYIDENDNIIFLF